LSPSSFAAVVQKVTWLQIPKGDLTVLSTKLKVSGRKGLLLIRGKKIKGVLKDCLKIFGIK